MATKKMVELNTSSMADIAFLMLTFFLMTTVISNEKGLPILLPPLDNSGKIIDIADRNLFTIQINSQDALLIEGQPKQNLSGLRQQLKAFILNNGSDPHLSDNPKEAIISLKADRGTSHKAFVSALDEIQGVYYEIYGQQAGISAAEFRALDPSIAAQKKLYDRGRAGVPMNISIAEPTHSVGY